MKKSFTNKTSPRLASIPKLLLAGIAACAFSANVFAAVNVSFTASTPAANTSATPIIVTEGSAYTLPIEGTVTGLGSSSNHVTISYSTLAPFTSATPSTTAGMVTTGTGPFNSVDHNGSSVAHVDFGWTPTNAQAGNNYSVTYTLSSPATSATASRTFYFHVNPKPCGTLSLTFTKTKISCNGGSNGAIDISVSGNVNSLSYAWSGPNSFSSTDEDLTGLSVGTYTVSVTEAGCSTLVQSFHVCEPPAIDLTNVTATDANCYGSTDGQATVTPTGGTPGYTYSWNTSPAQTSATATGLAAGTYTVTVKDANNCPASTTATVGQPTQLVASSTHTDVTCYGGSNGTVTVTATGGTTPYASGTGTTSGYSAGPYSIVVTDAHGCTATTTGTVSQPTALSATFDATTSCLLWGYDNEISATAGGGTPGYTFSNWTVSATGASITGSSTSGTTSTATFAAGTSAPPSSGTVTFTVKITDANGCYNTFSKTRCITDVRCGNGGNAYGKISICHKAGTNKYQMICVSNDATTIADHLSHGDNIGACNQARMGNIAEEGVFGVYPNPNNGSMSITLAEDAGAKVTVTDIQGRVILSKEFTAGNTTIKVDMPQVNPGVYFLNVENGNSQYNTKVSIQ